MRLWPATQLPSAAHLSIHLYSRFDALPQAGRPTTSTIALIAITFDIIIVSTVNTQCVKDFLNNVVQRFYRHSHFLSCAAYKIALAGHCA
jgi:hypothetical protein